MTPLKLPKATPKPITVALEGEFSDSGTGARPFAIKTLSLQFDKGGAIFTKGLPICKWGPISEFSISQACRKALVGHGEVEIEAEVPEQPAFHTEAPMEIFNGPPQAGRPILIYHVYAHVPAATNFLTSAVVEKGRGRFGTQTTIQIPTFISGYGSLTGFQAEVGKTWSYRGKKVSLFTAHCRKGSLLVHDEIEYVDGNEQEGDLIQPCTPVDSQARRNALAAADERIRQDGLLR